MTRRSQEPLRVLGHPLHAMLVSLPLGTLALVPLWDALAVFRVVSAATVVAYFSQLSGLIAAFFAIATGLWDLIALSERHKLLETGFRHALATLSAMGLFVVAFVLRKPDTTPDWMVCALDLGGAVLLSVGGWFGGHLVFHHRAGVND